MVSFANFPELIDAMGGITYRGGCVVSRINGGFKNGGFTLRLQAGKTHINGKQALALARTRKNDCNKREDDLTRARRQQKIISAMKRRLLSPCAFVRLPLISWEAPKALRSDMSGPTLLGLFAALAITGSPQTQVLGTQSGEVPDAVRLRAGAAAARRLSVSARRAGAGLLAALGRTSTSRSPSDFVAGSDFETDSDDDDEDEESELEDRRRTSTRTSRRRPWTRRPSCPPRTSRARAGASWSRSRCCRSPCP